MYYITYITYKHFWALGSLQVGGFLGENPLNRNQQFLKKVSLPINSHWAEIIQTNTVLRMQSNWCYSD